MLRAWQISHDDVVVEILAISPPVVQVLGNCPFGTLIMDEDDMSSSEEAEDETLTDVSTHRIKAEGQSADRSSASQGQSQLSIQKRRRVTRGANPLFAFLMLTADSISL